MSYATKEQLQELAAYMASQINVPTIGIGGGYAPVGTIISFMGTTAPQDYLACDGSTKNIADYPQLAAFFESQFGSKSYFGGDGTTTFSVPDLRGEFLRGTGTNGHANQGNGAAVGGHQDGSKIQSVVANASAKKVSWRLPSNTTDGVKNLQPDYSLISTEATRGRIRSPEYEWVDESSMNFGYAYTTRPTNTSILWCIKATSVNENMDTTGSVYITKPNTWTPNTEYDFGNGVYGQRFIGTLTTSANTIATQPLFWVNNNTSTVLNSGGYFNIIDHTAQYPNDSQIYINSVRYAGGEFRAQGYLIRTSAGSVMLQYKSSLALTDAPYDIWLTYTKA